MNKRLIYLVAILVFVSLACDIGGIGAKATETPLPPPPPPATEPPPPPTAEAPQADAPTEAAAPAADSGGYFVDEFDGDLENWQSFVVVGNPDKQYIRQVGGDRMKFELPSQDTSAYFERTDSVLGDVLFETNVETVGGDDNAIMLFCRGSEKGWYEMRVHTVGRMAGTYEMYRFDAKLRSRNQNPYVNLMENIERYSTYDIKSGFKVNDLGLLCQGDEIRLIINGVEQLPMSDHTDIIHDGTLTEGTVGIGVMTFGFGPTNIEFESVAASQP